MGNNVVYNKLRRLHKEEDKKKQKSVCWGRNRRSRRRGSGENLAITWLKIVAKKKICVHSVDLRDVVQQVFHEGDWVVGLEGRRWSKATLKSIYDFNLIISMDSLKIQILAMTSVLSKSTAYAVLSVCRAFGYRWLLIFQSDDSNVMRNASGNVVCWFDWYHVVAHYWIALRSLVSSNYAFTPSHPPLPIYAKALPDQLKDFNPENSKCNSSS
jgi:hypothetical protein